MQTKPFISEYKGHTILQIHEVDAAGNPTKKSPIISFGLNKASAILSQMENIKKFVEKQQEGKREADIKPFGE